MKIGYILKHYESGFSKETIINRTQELESSKLNSLWLSDHILMPRESRLTRYNSITEAITTMSYLAGSTNSLEFGISTLVLPQRHPILVAKQLATLHYFIGDRMHFSFGAGWCEEEFGFLDWEFNNRGDRFNEALQIIRSLWQGKSGFSGNYYAYDDAVFEPRRDGLSEIPIAIAGNSEAAVKRALALGNIWHPVNIDPSQIQAYQEQIEGADKLEIILRLAIKDEKELTQSISEYLEIGIDQFLLDDRGSTVVFEAIMDYVNNNS